ncbi:hypothetical protein PF010_g40 [Phytophthora fragariae]|uniref:Uncharacterized protein n=1 Tax=Phytophthora fragariae TaxID=53985 RepID=A0A6G0PWH4_9STRA|nr:hypothetical protein PF010_g40 [Phytophthora fragariae]KAE9256592.1 hypothetical protein PF004_g41 [Phytophthora fragariae]
MFYQCLFLNFKLCEKAPTIRDGDVEQSFHFDFLAEAIYEPRDAFVYAASLNQVEVVRRWIVKKLNINELDKDGNHALYMAAQNESLEVLQLLLTSGANVGQQQGDGKTALHAACTWGRIDAARMLLANQANVGSRDNDGQVPLHCACRNGHEELVRLLLDSGVDLFVADDIGATPIDVARDWQRLDILDTLAAYRANEFREANRERVELAVNGLSNQVELPQGVRDIIADYLC